MPANLENSAVATGLQKSVFIPIPKKGNVKECPNYHTIALISHASKFISVAQLYLTLCNPMHYSMPGFPITNSQGLLKIMSIESVIQSNHLILCHHLLLLPSIFSSRVFSNESAFCIRWLNYWSFSFSISPSS